jgi:ribosomal protein S18 acetylase RimI-like enzyme
VENLNEELYLSFRNEIEKICTPEILKEVTTIKIIEDDKQVGIMCYIRQDGFAYIDAIYIKPEYRRSGIARNTVLNWYEDFKDTEIRLHIVKKNHPAYKFWNSIFRLETIEETFLDVLYKVKGLVNYESSKKEK